MAAGNQAKTAKSRGDGILADSLPEFLRDHLLIARNAASQPSSGR